MPFQNNEDTSKKTTAERIGAVDDAAWSSGDGTVISVLKAIADGGGGGGGGAVTVADGADVAQGATTDLTSANTVIGRLKNLLSRWPAALGGTTSANSLPVTLASDGQFVTSVGNPSDGAATGDGTAIGLLKRLRTLLSGGLPAALGQTTKATSLAVVPPSDYQMPVLNYSTAPAALTNATSNNSNMLADTDVGAYRTIIIQLLGTWVATVQVQISLDGGATFQPLWLSNAQGVVLNASVTSNNIYIANIPGGALLRVRTTAYTSGTITGFYTLSTLPFSPLLMPTALVNASGNALNTGTLAGDNNGTSLTMLSVASWGMLFDGGSAYNRARNNNALSILTSSARTSTTNSTDQVNYNWRGLQLFLNISAQSGGSVQLSLQVKDSISSNYMTVWTAAAPQTTVGTYVYMLYPGALDLASFTEVVQLALAARTFRVVATHANGSSITYSVSADMLL